jgi:hypothetical protein
VKLPRIRPWPKPNGALALVSLTFLSGCSAVLPPPAFEGTAPEMRPEAFFAGQTTSTGVLENRSGAPTQRFQVQGSGELRPDGRLQLVQSITFEGQPPRERTWVLTKVDDHHYVGTLSDASGSVHAEAYGNLFYVNYPMKEPSLGRMEQWLYLQPDGRTVVNESTVSLLGITAVRLSERITHSAVDGTGEP